VSSDAAFLAAIRDAPDDDTARLVYADWLAERDDPRGELLHAQVALAGLDPADAAYLDLADRECRWLAAHAEACYPGRPRTDGIAWRFRRGLPEAVEVEKYAAFQAAAAAALRAGVPLFAATIRRLTSCKALARTPLAATLHELHLRECPVGDDGIEHLAASPLMARLTALTLDHNRLGSAACEALSASPNAAGLRKLALTHNHVGDDGLAALARSRHLRPTRLGLVDNWAGRTGVEALAGSDLLARVADLTLGYNDLGDAGLSALFRPGRLANLERLDLEAVECGPDGIGHLARAALPRLRRLTLAAFEGEDEALTALAAAAFLPCLDTLHLRSILPGRGVAALLAAGLPALRSLALAGVEADPALAEAFAARRPVASWKALHLWPRAPLTGDVLAALAAPALGSLTRLEVGQSGLGDAGARAVAASPALAGLRSLELYHNEIGPEGALALGASLHLRRLRRLRLAWNPLGSGGLACLLDAKDPPPLAWLDLSHVRLGPGGVRPLVEHGGRLPLTRLNLGMNSLTDDDAIALARSPLFGRLTKLDLCGNPIGEAGLRALLDAAEVNPTLRLIVSWSYPFPNEALQARVAALGPRVEMRHGYQWDADSW